MDKTEGGWLVSYITIKLVVDLGEKSKLNLGVMLIMSEWKQLNLFYNYVLYIVAIFDVANKNF